jgi:hypothetical protein
MLCTPFTRLNVFFIIEGALHEVCHKRLAGKKFFPTGSAEAGRRKSGQRPNAEMLAQRANLHDRPGSNRYSDSAKTPPSDGACRPMPTQPLTRSALGCRIGTNECVCHAKMFSSSLVADELCGGYFKKWINVKLINSE